MTEDDIECLKKNIDKSVEIETADGEHLVAKVVFVTHDEEYDEHDVLYEMISSNKIEAYAHLDNAGGYILDFADIISVKALPNAT